MAFQAQQVSWGRGQGIHPHQGDPEQTHEEPHGTVFEGLGGVDVAAEVHVRSPGQPENREGEAHGCVETMVEIVSHKKTNIGCHQRNCPKEGLR